MINGTVYNSPNLASNRRDHVIMQQQQHPDHIRTPGDGGSLSNPDVVPSEQFPSINVNDKARLAAVERDEGNSNNFRKSPNQGNLSYLNCLLYNDLCR